MPTTATRHGHSAGGFALVRSTVITLSRALTVGVSSVAGAPIGIRGHHDDVPEETGTARWVLFVISMVLVLLGGAFAGLTIALMGQDTIYLQVIAGDPFEPQAKNAKRVRDLLQRGKHWVLVTLLLSNVIVNETLPVVLDRCLGGGVAAVVGSTVLIGMYSPAPLLASSDQVNNSHLRRSRPPICLCPLWPANWRYHVQACSPDDVAHGAPCLAHR